MCVPGHVENSFILLDLKEVTIATVPINRIKTFASTLLENYRGNLFRLVIVNSTWLVRGMFNFVYPVFDGYTRQKILISGDGDSKEFQRDIVSQFFDINKMEKKYGGKLPDLEKNFFPHKF